MWNILYKHASGDTTICHGLAYVGQTGYYTGPLGDSDLTETEWAVDPIKPIGALNSTPADRGNAMHTFDLWVERRFATEAEARVFAKHSRPPSRAAVYPSRSPMPPQARS